MYYVLFALALAVARPALRLGGEWAGWRCVFDPFSGALTNHVEGVTTERWAGNALQRRSLRLLPEATAGDGDGARIRCLAAPEEDWSTLPAANSGTSTLAPGARAAALAAGGLMWTVQVDMLNANAWALDEAGADPNAAGVPSWRCESVFDGLGGEQPRGPRRDRAERPKERTRVVCSFNPSTGEVARGEPVEVWQERCWSVQPLGEMPELRRDSGGRAGLDAAWVSSVVGTACFGSQKRIPYASGVEAALSRTRLSLPGGVEVRGRPGLLEVCVTAAPGRVNWRKLILRRSWIGGSCYASVETVGDRQAEPPVDEEDSEGPPGLTGG